LLLAVLKSRPFDTGNARVALLATAVFLNLNGVDLDADDGGLVALVAVASDEGLTVLQAAAVLERISLRPGAGSW
jgi:prophage maintenance system killer protein